MNKDLDLETKEQDFRESSDTEAKDSAKKNKTNYIDERQKMDDDKSDNIEDDKI
jgi:ribosomal protein L29